MDAHAASHPTDRALSGFGLGKLDDASAEAVNKHLEHCADCRNRVAELAPDSFLGRIRQAQKPATHAMSAPSQPDATKSYKGANGSAAPLGHTLPPGLADHPDYQIKRELGRGGMGVVYLAHNKWMDRDEVLKVMGRHIMERPGVLERFQREIRAVAKLRHPNIVTAYHATQMGESLVFAMEYVEGADLAKLIKAKGPLAVGYACNFIHQAALGLQHAHEEGLVHRDIKPGNLMFSNKGGKATIKLLDFGLARATREGKVDSSLTYEGQALGTPDFIAPEQILDAAKADIRADVYSLGGTLFYLLTGRPPFQGNTPYDVYQGHISRDAEPLNLIRPAVPVELAALVAKMLAKEQRRRFQTPVEVAEALLPFFKKGSVAFKEPRAVVSPTSQPTVGRPEARADSTPAQRATNAGGLVIQTQKAAEPTVADVRWEGLIEMRDADSSPDRSPFAAPVRRLPRWSWPVAITAAVFGLIALSIIIITIRSRSGHTEITVTDDAPFKLESKDITVEHKPAHPSGLSSDTAKGQEAVTPVKPPVSIAGQDGLVRLFNGKELTGLKDVTPNERGWNVSSELLVGKGRLLTERQDFTDFRLRSKFRFQKEGGGRIEVRHTSADGARNAYPIKLGASSGTIEPPVGTVAKINHFPYGRGVPWGNPAKPIPVNVGQWNVLTISALKNRITTQVNGQVVAEYTDPDALGWYASGEIAFFVFDDIQFQEINIEELPADSGPKPIVQSEPAKLTATPKGKALAKESRGPSREIRRGMRWIGMKDWTLDGATQPPGTRQVIALEITEVSENRFSGLFNWGPGFRPGQDEDATHQQLDPSKRCVVRGNIQGADIEWTGDGTRPLATYRARVEGLSLRGKCDNGVFSMDLVE